MKKKYFVFLFLILTISSVSSLQINDTIFFASETNFTIFVDSITLDQVTVTNQSITFINLTSVGSNFTNINATFDARADFIGLALGLAIRNLNTSTDIFLSSVGDQNFNATFLSGHTIRTQLGITPPFVEPYCSAVLDGLGIGIETLAALGVIALLVLSLIIFAGLILFNKSTGDLSDLGIGITQLLVALVLMVVAIIISQAVCSI